jgi:putative ABC transport system substrate-binding protein
MMNRRRFLLTSLAGALAAPRGGQAQQAVGRQIAFLETGSSPPTPVAVSFWEAFLAGLREKGWVESRNITIERRYAGMQQETARAAVEEVLRRGVEVIVVSSTQTALAAKEVTRTVPIVMTIPADPVAVGLVDSLARPGGNVTGLSFVGTEVVAKQVELLKEAVSGLASIAVLSNPLNASHPPRTKQILAVSRTLGLRVEALEASSLGGIADAFTAMVKRGVGAAIVLADPLFVREATVINRLAAQHRLPAMHGLREVALAGGLISYGPSFTDLFRRAGGYVDKILRGAKPSDLPIEQASTFELVINLKTAKALGLTIPPSLLARADQVIDP